MTTYNLWRINGKTYNFENFKKNHPGGSYVIEETKGHDITYLFQCNHNLTEDQATEILKKYEVQDKNDLPIIKWDSELDKIHQSLNMNHIHFTKLKTPIWGCIYYLFIGYFYIYSFKSWLFENKYGFLFGWLGVLLGLMQHEACHNAFSKYPLLNYLGRYSLVPWASPQQWFVRHTIKHHQFTNTIKDEDYITTDNVLIRHHYHNELHSFHKIQILSVILYGFIISFFISIGYITILQFLLIGTHYYYHQNIIDCFIPFLVFGSYFLFISQLNHIQENTMPSKILEYPDSFVKNQLQSSQDYSYSNLLVSCFVSFLNYQSLHHLFPSISHFYFFTHQDIFIKVLKENNYTIQQSSLFNVIKNYISHLYNLSTKKKFI